MSTPRAARDAWKTLVASASAPYRAAGRFAWHFARGKLGHDPVFEHLIRTGVVGREARVLDLGCGQGLLASLLRAAEALDRDGRWPGEWAPAPAGVRVTGIELMPRDVARARAALGADANVVCGDMRSAGFPASDIVVLLDSLHYIGSAEQDAVLARAQAVLAPGGSIVMRVGDGAARAGSLASRTVDHVVAWFRRREVVPQASRPAAAWIEQLRTLGFIVQTQPMDRGTPFSNVLMIGRLANAVERPAQGAEPVFERPPVAAAMSALGSTPAPASASPPAAESRLVLR